MLEKESGHPVSQMDSRHASSLNLHPKEADNLIVNISGAKGIKTIKIYICKK